MKQSNHIFIYVLIRSWKSFKNFDRCLDSVLSQKYKKFKILFVDDASGYDINKKEYIKKKLKGHVAVFNKSRKYSLFNAYSLIHKYAKNNKAVVFNLDGDDWLPHNMVFQKVARVYYINKNCLFTYGSCLVWNGEDFIETTDIFPNNVNSRYSKQVESHNYYRKEFFKPLHPRTWRVDIFKSIKKENFLRSDGSWISFAEDQAIFYPMLEMSKGNYRVLSEPLYVYDQSSKFADSKVNLYEQIKDEIIIRRKKLNNPSFKELRNVYLHFNKIPSIPLLGNLIYTIQIFLFNKNLLNHLLVSLRDKPLKDELFRTVNNSKLNLFINSWMFESRLKKIKSNIVLNFKTKSLKDLNKDDLYRIKWCLVYGSFITKNSHKSLIKIIPSNYPIFEK